MSGRNIHLADQLKAANREAAQSHAAQAAAPGAVTAEVPATPDIFRQVAETLATQVRHRTGQASTCAHIRPGPRPVHAVSWLPVLACEPCAKPWWSNPAPAGTPCRHCGQAATMTAAGHVAEVYLVKVAVCVPCATDLGIPAHPALAPRPLRWRVSHSTKRKPRR
jgi:hypothetical protein